MHETDDGIVSILVGEAILGKALVIVAIPSRRCVRFLVIAIQMLRVSLTLLRLSYG